MALVCLLVPALAGTAAAEPSPTSGGATFEPPPPPPAKATVVNGKAIAPANAPSRVRRVIEAGNRLIGKPYIYGGGHKPFSSRLDRGYDCSGTASYALFGGRFLRLPMPSGSFMTWGQTGPGTWITTYAHSGHMYLVVAGLRLDTGMRDDPTSTGPAWSKRLRPADAYVARHPRGY
ncbi:MAG: C40 family peptidase [Thermoleophilaceae bacterium]|nr:C40 family peptidase [Thermoleophilaceae bacterium]